MKIKALLLAAVFAAGGAASFAFAKPPHPTPGTSTASTITTTTTTPGKPKCDHVSLHGNATAGSITFTVTKANAHHRSLVNTSVTLTVPAGAKVKANACSTGGTLTLRNLKVDVKPAKP
jgi:heme-binding NEAT domain protein